MTFDALTLTALRQELTGLLIGGRVQRVVRVSELAIGLEVYAGERYQLLLSAEADAPQVRLVDFKLRRGEEKPSPLSLLLKKHVDGARLMAISQPELERVLRLCFEGEHGEVHLICELMGNLSNLILVDGQGRIMEAAKRVPASLNRYREVLPRRAYVPPPPQSKLHPLAASPSDLFAALQTSEEPMARRLAQAVAGVSPLLAREALYRATGGEPLPLTLPLCEQLLAQLGALWGLAESGEWHPTVGCTIEEGGLVPRAFAPYLLMHWPEREYQPTVSAAAARVLDAETVDDGMTGSAPLDGYERARARLDQMIAQQLARRERRLASLQEGLVTPDELEALRLEASAILAAAWRIEAGQSKVEVTRSEVTGEMGEQGEQVWSIPLDPDLLPAENAERRFAEYRKRQAALAQVPGLIAEVELELAQLRQFQTDVALAADRGQLDEVEAALQAEGYLRRRPKRVAAASSEPLVVLAPDGTQILVGRNSRQNAEVTFHRAAPDDLWLHAHVVPGSHVIIRCGQRPVSPETLEIAARLAARYSAARGEAMVQVDYTERKYVRPIAGAGPGLVTFRNERTITVPPDIAGIKGA